MKRISGTLEWAVKNVNCVKGCKHNCRYCYARTRALQLKQIPDAAAWENMEIREHDVKKGRKKENGTVMFPTTHDILPGDILEASVVVLRKLLEAGNNVLIVSKPHLECIDRLCKEFAEYKNQILFRFTIGAMGYETLKYWEPGAPTFIERLACLQFAFELGFRTSVSCEPMLDNMPNMVKLFHILQTDSTDSIWMGKMNKVRQRVKVETAEDERQVARIEVSQTDENIWQLYNVLKNEPKIRWKESVKQIIGINTPTEPGMDV
jgi:DNA repair photolyase